MFLSSPEEVLKYVGATLQDALARLAGDDRLAGGPTRLRFGVVDPDCVLYIDTEQHQVWLGATTDTPTSDMVAMDGDTALRYCLGLLDVDSAVAAGEIATAGDCRLLDALSHEGLPEIFAHVMQREGRSDLLAAA